MAARQAFDAVCDAGSPTTQSPITTDTPAGQDACLNALMTLSSNAASCATTPTTICSGACRGYYEAVFDNCSPEVSLMFM